jgi:hypothetical protein
VDAGGNVYVGGANRIRKVTPAGVVTTLVGVGEGPIGFADGPGREALFAQSLSPFGMAVDAAGNIYVGDSGNNRIRKVTPVGRGQLGVFWSAPSTDGGSPITGYTASARAPGQPTRTCATTGSTSCTIDGLTDGFAYDVTITATNAVGTSLPSADIGAGLGLDGTALARAIPTMGCGLQASQTPGQTTRGTIQTMGTKAAGCADTKCGPWSYEREYYVTLPLGYDKSKPYPIVFQGPGCGGTVQNLYALNLDGDPTKPNVDDSVIRVGLMPPPTDIGYPVDPNFGCFDDHEGDDSVDWVFYENLYDQLASELCFDRNRVFVSGESWNQGLNYGGGGWWANELACKYAGDPTRPVRGALAIRGDLPTDPKSAPTCTSKPMSGIWVVSRMQPPPTPAIPSPKAAIARAMKVNGCTMGTGLDDATFADFPIGVNALDGICLQIAGCPDITPLVVCTVPQQGPVTPADVINPGFSAFIDLLGKPPLRAP